MNKNPWLNFDFESFKQAQELLMEARCDDCYGSGQQDDLEPGDISGSVWQCDSCKGSGFCIPSNSEI